MENRELIRNKILIWPVMQKWKGPRIKMERERFKVTRTRNYWPTVECCEQGGVEAEPLEPDQRKGQPDRILQSTTIFPFYKLAKMNIFASV